MVGKKALIGAATGGIASGLWWAGVSAPEESKIHPVPIAGGAAAGALAGSIAHDDVVKTAAVSALAGLGGGAMAQYIKLRWFSA